ncbi:MAG: hypothetical protein ACU826_08510 [Gammaproteobacteria bacterium]
MAGSLIAINFAYSFAVAYNQWKWFPKQEDRGLIAEVPADLVNYAALLLPWALLLACLLARRLYFKQPFE